MKYAVLFIMLLFVTAAIYAQTPINWTYAKGFTSSGMMGKVASATTDQSGNTFLAGTFDGITDFEINEEIADGDEDGFVMKLNSAGVAVWLATASSGVTTLFNDVITDAVGNIYVLGTTIGTTTFGTALTLPEPANQTKSFIAKLNPDGQWIWVTDAFSDSGDEAMNFILKSNDKFFLLGTNKDTGNIFVTKLNQLGDPDWKTEANASIPSTSKAKAIVLDYTGKIIILSQFKGSFNFGTTTVSQTGNLDNFVVAKINDSGTWEWATDADVITDSVEVVDLKTDSSNDIFVAGSYKGSMVTGQLALPASSVKNLMLLKINPAGQFVDEIDNYTSVSSVKPAHILIDQDDKIYVIGVSKGNNGTFGSTQIPAGFFVAKLTMVGVLQNLNVQAAVTTADANALVNDQNGNIIMGGNYTGAPQFGSAVLPATSNNVNLFVAKATNIYPLANNDTVVPVVSSSISVWPNPSMSTMNIDYKNGQSAKPDIRVFNLKGQLVRTMIGTKDTNGVFSVQWDGKDKSGTPVQAGIYIVQVKTSTEILSKKVLMLR